MIRLRWVARLAADESSKQDTTDSRDQTSLTVKWYGNGVLLCDKEDVVYFNIS